MTSTAPVSERERQLIASIPTGLFINGQWRPAMDGETYYNRGLVEEYFLRRRRNSDSATCRRDVSSIPDLMLSEDCSR